MTIINNVNDYKFLILNVRNIIIFQIIVTY